MPVTRGLHGMNIQDVFIRCSNPGRAFSICVCASVLILTGGCAYFNTYYNAETAYKNARQEHEKFLSMQEDTATEVPPEVITGYERAIEKSQKLLEVYPKNKKWHDDALFLMGRTEYYKKEPISAVRRFKQLQKEFPQSVHIPQSHLFMGKAYLSAGDLRRAEQAFDQILQTYPFLNDREEITLLLAQVAIEREGKAQAIELLKKTLLSVKTPEKRMEISLQIAELYMELNQHEKAIAVLKKAPRKRNLHKYLYRIDYALLTCYVRVERYQDAATLAEKMIRNRRYLKHYPHIALQKGIVFARTEKTDKALGLFEEITLGEGPDAIKGKAHLELGAIYQFRKEDLEKAHENYQKAIPLLADDELRELAQSRRDAINELKRLREIVESGEADTTGRHTSIAYRIGEIFWLRLEEPDSALHYFSRMEQNAGDDSMSVAKSMYARGWIWLHIKNDTTTADSILNLVIDRYPETVFAQKSQQQLGKTVTVMTREDSARAAFLEAERLYFEDRDAIASTNAYIKVAQTYDELPVAPKSMYAAAWLCDNILHKNVTARTLYKKVCENYPEDELCRSQVRTRLAAVEDTLRSLGQSPSDISSRNRKAKKKNGEIEADQTFDDVDWEADEEPPPLPALPSRKKPVDKPQ